MMRLAPCYACWVIPRTKPKGLAVMALLLGVAMAACHQEEQAVVGGWRKPR